MKMVRRSKFCENDRRVYEEGMGSKFGKMVGGYQSGREATKVVGVKIWENGMGTIESGRGL